MFITKKYIPRRTFLRGMGVTLALPLLESMLPAQTPLSQTAANPATRFVGVFGPHGWAPGYWVPEKDGSDFEFTRITSPLEPLRSQVIIFSGLDATSSMPHKGESGGDHSRAAAFLTGAAPKRTVGADIFVGTSIDQMIAKKIGQDTILPSFQLGIEDVSSNSGACGYGYSCAYSNSISWPTPSRYLPVEINPMVAFERLYGDGSTPEARVTRRQEDRSILDAVTHEIAPLRNKIGPTDRIRLNDYLEDIREIERRLQLAVKASSVAPSWDAPYGVPSSFDEHLKLQYDLLSLAFQGNITRVSTLMFARDTCHRVIPECGMTTAFHEASHHGEDPKRREEYSRMNRYFVGQLAAFAKKLKNTPDGDGSLLDHSVILAGSNMGNANVHGHVNVGHALVGGASGKLKGGRHIRSAEGTPTANLLLSTLDLFGIHEDSIGDSTGRVDL